MIFLPYLILAFVLFILYFVEQGKIKGLSKKQARWTAYTIMWLFIGLRGHLMSDFILYYPYYNNYPDLFHLNIDAFLNGFGSGFNMYTSIIRTFTDNYFVWVAINTLIDLIVFAWFFNKYCRSMILPLIFFIAFNGLTIEFNLYRNIKAIDLFLLSIPYLQQRRMLPYILLNILGITFHSSSMLYLPLYFVLNVSMNRYVKWGGFVVANLIYWCHIGIIGYLINHLSFLPLSAYDKIVWYIDTADTTKFTLGYFERTFTFILFSIFYSKFVEQNKANSFFYNCYWIYYCLFLVFYEVHVFSSRISFLFIFAYWILYPALCLIRNRNQQLIKTSVLVIVILRIVTSFDIPSATYQSILFTKPDYELSKEITENDIINL